MKKSTRLFEGRTLLIATKHGKEQVLAPLLEKELGVKCILAENFDTDQLGTFTGEIERKDDAFATARKKCLLAMEFTGYDLVLASEGSFGAHPSLYFVAADDELLMFIDQKNDLEITVREISTETNFNGKSIKSEKQLREFAKDASFPEHALILRKAEDDFSEMKKGIQDWSTLKEIYQQFSQAKGKVYVETDMRAMYNPSRMKVIEKAAIKLAEKINSVCPNCNIPGFSITVSRNGLPCENCSAPTRSTLSYIYNCQKCDFSEEKKFPHGKMVEDPTFCDRCNP